MTEIEGFVWSCSCPGGKGIELSILWNCGFAGLITTELATFYVQNSCLDKGFASKSAAIFV